MKKSTYDLCLLIADRPTNEFAFIGMPKDDTLILPATKFDSIKSEQLEEAQLRAKNKKKLTQETYFDFNGTKVSISEKNYGAIHQGQRGQAKKY